VNIPRIGAIRSADLPSGEADVQNLPRPVRQPFWKSRVERDKLRLERDIARGYSITVKQVILAFAVEFVIIGLILTGQYVYAVQLPNASQYVIAQTMLFPIGLAMVELARVPLAVAVRTQKSWNIQLAALFGVACAVVVTSASLYQIGNFTFQPRLEEVHQKRNALLLAQEQTQAFATKRGEAQDVLEASTEHWSTLNTTYDNLTSQLNKQPGQTCTPVTAPGPDGSPVTRQQCRENPALKSLRAEIDAAKLKLTQADAAVRQARVDLGKFDSRSVDEAITRAEAEYREAIYRSPLHSYTGMLFSKNSRDVTEGQVKTLEWYLILIPSIAAALSSTLIAMTAVHRIKRREPDVATIPNDAVTYLFGPLLEVIRKEARQTVEAAVKSTSNATPSQGNVTG